MRKNASKNRIENKAYARNRVLTVPNLLTILRILLGPVFIYAILKQNLFAALLIFFIAAITDMLDGFIARHFKAQSKFGEVIDPAADKLLMTTAYIILTFDHSYLTVTIPPWLTVTVIGRDLFIVIGCAVVLYMQGQLIISPIKISKITTFMEILTIFLCILYNYIGLDHYSFLILMAITAFLCLFSAIGYIKAGMVQLEHI
jgi:cardiolipin synthase